MRGEAEALALLRPTEPSVGRCWAAPSATLRSLRFCCARCVFRGGGACPAPPNRAFGGAQLGKCSCRNLSCLMFLQAERDCRTTVGSPLFIIAE